MNTDSRAHKVSISIVMHHEPMPKYMKGTEQKGESTPPRYAKGSIDTRESTPPKYKNGTVQTEQSTQPAYADGSGGPQQQNYPAALPYAGNSAAEYLQSRDSNASAWVDDPATGFRKPIAYGYNRNVHRPTTPPGGGGFHWPFPWGWLDRQKPVNNIAPRPPGDHEVFPQANKIPGKTVNDNEETETYAKGTKKAPKLPPLGSGERFKQLSGKLESKGATNPDALAAWIGRRKYGNKKMAQLSQGGR